MSDASATRASDADRERLAEALREHFAAGRLSAEDGASGNLWPVWLLIFPAVFLVGSVRRVHGPAPELDRVQRELEHGPSRRRHHHRRLP